MQRANDRSTLFPFCLAGLLALTSAIAACSSSSGTAPSGVPNAVTAAAQGKVAVSLNLSKLLALQQRQPKFIGANASTVVYAITQNGNPVTNGSFTLSPQCAGNVCPLITLNAGSGYSLAITLQFGSTPIGQGSTASPFMISSGVTNDVTVTINPITGGQGVSGPTVGVDPAVQPTPFFVSNQTPQSLPLDIQELDPVGNVIYTNAGPVNNWVAWNFNLSDAANFSMATSPITTPPALPAGTVDNILYSGNNLISIAETSVTVSVTDWNSVTSNSISIPIVNMVSTSYQLTTVNAGDSASFTVTEAAPDNPTTLSLSPSPPDASASCGPGTISIVQSGSYVVSGTSVQGTFLVQQVGGTPPVCTIAVSATDANGSSVGYTIDVGVNEGGNPDSSKRKPASRK